MSFFALKHHVRICQKTATSFLWLTSTKFSFLCSKMKCRSHKIDNSYKLSLRESFTHPFRPSSVYFPTFFEKKSLNICYLYFDLYWSSFISLCVSWSSLRGPSLVSLKSEKKNKQLFKQLYSCHFLSYLSHKKQKKMRGTCILYNISLRYHWINKEYYLNMQQQVHS